MAGLLIEPVHDNGASRVSGTILTRAVQKVSVKEDHVPRLRYDWHLLGVVKSVGLTGVVKLF